MGFLSLALQLSFLPVAVGDAVEIDSTPMFVETQGVGEPAKSGDRVTLHYSVVDANGKELANSERRGLPQTMDLFGDTSDLLLQSASIGAREGESRFVILMAENTYPEVGIFNIVRNPGPLLVWVRVERILRR